MTLSALLLVIVAAICHASWNLLAKRAAHVAPAREMSMLLVTLAGLYILREPVGWGRLVGCCLIALGVVMLVGG
jgi:drug/metabolite transporter (DMT)-like permease